jgi:hypothetical protein
MDPMIMVGAALGSLLTWAISKYFYDQRERTRLLRMTQQMKLPADHFDAYCAITTKAQRSALELIEAGDLDGAREQLVRTIAIYYQTQSEGRRLLREMGIPPEEVDRTGEELEAIERDARRFPALRTALAQKPN